MAVNRVPVLKRCRSLGLDPIYLGIDKKSTRQLKRMRAPPRPSSRVLSGIQSPGGRPSGRRGG